MVHAASLTHINQPMESSAAFAIRQTSVPPPPSPLSLSLCSSILSVFALCLCSFLFPYSASLSNASLCPRYRLWHGGRLHIEYRLSSAWNFNANQLWCLIEWRGPWTDSRGHSKTWRGGIRGSLLSICVS